jgi:hypothetical protein
MNVLRPGITALAAVAAGSFVNIVGKEESGLPELYAFFATVAAVVLLCCCLVRDRQTTAHLPNMGLFYVYTIAFIIGAPLLLGFSGRSALWGLSWIVPILFWLMFFLRKRAWLPASTAWLVLTAATAALIYNSRHADSGSGLWITWIARF